MLKGVTQYALLDSPVIPIDPAPFVWPKPVACFDANCAPETHSVLSGYWFSAFALPR